MLIKTLFHFNGHKYSNDKFLVSGETSNGGQNEDTNDSHQNKIYINNDKSIVHLLSNKIVITDVILNLVLFLLYFLPLEKDTEVI